MKYITPLILISLILFFVWEKKTTSNETIEKTLKDKGIILLKDSAPLSGITDLNQIISTVPPGAKIESIFKTKTSTFWVLYTLDKKKYRISIETSIITVHVTSLTVVE